MKPEDSMIQHSDLKSRQSIEGRRTRNDRGRSNVLGSLPLKYSMLLMARDSVPIAD